MPITKEQILDGINKCKSVKELCSLLNVKYGTLYSRCKEYNISLNKFISEIFGVLLLIEVFPLAVFLIFIGLK